MVTVAIAGVGACAIVVGFAFRLAFPDTIVPFGYAFLLLAGALVGLAIFAAFGFWALFGRDRGCIHITNTHHNLSVFPTGEANVHIATLWDDGRPRFGFSRMFGPVDPTAWVWPSNFSTIRLDIINDTPVALINLEIEMTAQILEVIPQESGSKSGAILFAEACTIYVPRLEPGSAKSTSVFVQNSTGHYVHLTVNKAYATPAGRKKVRIDVVNNNDRPLTLYI